MSDDESKRGMSTTVKILLFLLIGGGICFVACCGIGFYFLRNAVQMTTNPTEIQEIRESVVSIDIPASYQPQSAMTTQVMGVSMKMAMHQRGGGQNAGVLLLMQMKFPGEASDAQIKQSFEQQLNQQNQNEQVVVEESESRMFMIDGQETNFTFAKGTRQGTTQKVRQVQGVFPGKGGIVMFMLIEDEENWDEQAIIKTIESITAQ